MNWKLPSEAIYKAELADMEVGSMEDNDLQMNMINGIRALQAEKDLKEALNLLDMAAGFMHGTPTKEKQLEAFLTRFKPPTPCA